MHFTAPNKTDIGQKKLSQILFNCLGMQYSIQLVAHEIKKNVYTWVNRIQLSPMILKKTVQALQCTNIEGLQ